MLIPLGVLALGAAFSGMIWYNSFFGDDAKMRDVLRIGGTTLSEKGIRSANKVVDPLRSQTDLSREAVIAAFEAHFVGEVDTGGARSTYLYVGRGVDGAVAYVCDGDRGEWFTGSVDGDGAGELASRDGDATLTLTVVDGGLGAAVAATSSRWLS